MLSEIVAIAGAQKLVDSGFTNVYRLEGNYAAWVDAGYPVETQAVTILRKTGEKRVRGVSSRHD
jgi:3-mercaptopyruvate sulfurtransferase SseA